MEVFGIQTIRSVDTLHKKEGVVCSSPVDQITISSESEKKADWVDMLKNMSDIRPKEIEAALLSTPTGEQLAQKIIAS